MIQSNSPRKPIPAKRSRRFFVVIVVQHCGGRRLGFLYVTLLTGVGVNLTDALIGYEDFEGEKGYVGG